MTEEEFAKEMAWVKEHFEHDTEASHSAADALLCWALNELGYGEGISIYESLERWCA